MILQCALRESCLHACSLGADGNSVTFLSPLCGRYLAEEKTRTVV